MFASSFLALCKQQEVSSLPSTTKLGCCPASTRPDRQQNRLSPETHAVTINTARKTHPHDIELPTLSTETAFRKHTSSFIRENNLHSEEYSRSQTRILVGMFKSWASNAGNEGALESSLTRQQQTNKARNQDPHDTSAVSGPSTHKRQLWTPTTLWQCHRVILHSRFGQSRDGVPVAHKILDLGVTVVAPILTAFRSKNPLSVQ